MKKVGFLVNPIAGMGGKVGLKGTDGKLDAAIKLGAENISYGRSKLFFNGLNDKTISNVHWLICGGPMGMGTLKDKMSYDVVYSPQERTSSLDTREACRKFLCEGCDLIVFCGGDGTARDVFSVIGDKIPMLGIPSGVKMLSGVFAINPSAAAELIELYIGDEASVKDAEIVDLDEEQYRLDRFAFKIFGIAKTIFEGNYIQSSKVLLKGAEEDEIKKDISRTIIEDMGDDTLYLLGAGSTLRTIGEDMGIDKTLLGIDAVKGKKLVSKDLNETGLLELLKHHEKVKLIISPIGAQGFIVGRGNLQITPEVIKKIGLDNILIVSTPAKLKTIQHLLVDSGDADLDDMFNEKRYLPVIIGYRTSTIKNIGIQNL